MSLKRWIWRKEEIYPFIEGTALDEIRENFCLKYKFLIPKSFLDKSPLDKGCSTSVGNNMNVKKCSEESRFEFEYWRSINVIWQFSFEDDSTETIRTLYFEFWVIGYINESRQVYSYEILDPFKRNLKELHDNRISVSETLGLKSVNKLTSDFLGENAVGKVMEVSRRKKQLEEVPDFFRGTDFVLTSLNMKHLLSEISLFSAYVQDYTADPTETPNGVVYAHFYDGQYFFLISNYLFALFSFCDRLGKLISCFFDTGLSKYGRYFHKVIDSFNGFSEDESLSWLREFRNGKYEEYKTFRNEIAHHFGLEGKAYLDYSNNNRDIEGLQRVQEWKMNLLTDLLDLHKLSLKAFEETLKFIDNNAPNKQSEENEN